MVMFLNAPFRRDYAALSGLSDEREAPQGAASREEFCRVGIIPAERNI